MSCLYDEDMNLAPLMAKTQLDEFLIKTENNCVRREITENTINFSSL